MTLKLLIQGHKNVYAVSYTTVKKYLHIAQIPCEPVLAILSFEIGVLRKFWPGGITFALTSKRVIAAPTKHSLQLQEGCRSTSRHRKILMCIDRTAFRFRSLYRRIMRRKIIPAILLSALLTCQSYGTPSIASQAGGATVTPAPAPQQEKLQSGEGEAIPKPKKARSKRNPITQSGKASWYGPGFHGKPTASGEVFDQALLTAAHNTLPLGSRAKVTNLANGNSVEVKINDRGPFIPGRIIDLSHAAAGALGIVEAGIAQVRVEVLAVAVG
jgi:rare lipoprotein A